MKVKPGAGQGLEEKKADSSALARHVHGVGV